MFVVSGDALGRLHQTVSDIVHRLSVQQNATRVGLVTYTNNIRVHFQLDSYPTESSIRRILTGLSRSRRHISVDEAIEVMRTQVFTQSGDRPDVQNFAIVLLDNNMNAFNDFPNAKLAKDDGITMLAIGYGGINHVLREISSTRKSRSTEKSYWPRLPGPGEINVVIENLLCQMQTYRFKGNIFNSLLHFYQTEENIFRGNC